MKEHIDKYVTNTLNYEVRLNNKSTGIRARLREGDSCGYSLRLGAKYVNRWQNVVGLSRISKKKMLYYEDINSAHNLIAEESGTEELELREKKEKLELELQHYLKLLPHNDRKMLELKYFHKYSVKDLQKEFNLSASAVKMRLLRARQRIEQILEVRNAA